MIHPTWESAPCMTSYISTNWSHLMENCREDFSSIKTQSWSGEEQSPLTCPCVTVSVRWWCAGGVIRVCVMSSTSSCVVRPQRTSAMTAWSEAGSWWPSVWPSSPPHLASTPTWRATSTDTWTLWMTPKVRLLEPFFTWILSDSSYSSTLLNDPVLSVYLTYDRVSVCVLNTGGMSR